MDNTWNRRSFFKFSFAVLGAMGLGGVVASASKFLNSGRVSSKPHLAVKGAFAQDARSGAGGGGALMASKAPDGMYEIELDAVPQDSGVIVSAGALPVMVVRGSSGVRVFNATCSHLGCLVKWDPVQSMFVCPCHGGKYNADGQVVAGPPPYALKEHPAEEKDNLIRIAIA